MEKIDIDQIVAKADRRAVYLNQVKHAKDTFRARNILAWDGHIFELSESFLSYVYIRFMEWTTSVEESPDPIIILDKNEEPVLVEDVMAFVDAINEAHAEALNEYYDTYSRLQHAQSTEELIGVT